MLSEILSGVILFIIVSIVLVAVLGISLIMFLGVAEHSPNLLKLILLPLIIADRLILKMLALVLFTPIFLVCLKFKDLWTFWKREFDIKSGLELIKKEVF